MNVESPTARDGSGELHGRPDPAPPTGILKRHSVGNDHKPSVPFRRHSMADRYSPSVPGIQVDASQLKEVPKLDTSGNPFSQTAAHVHMKPIDSMQQGQPAAQQRLPPDQIMLYQLISQMSRLQERVRQLESELEDMRASATLAADNARAEKTMLQSEIDRQASRHESVCAALRERLVESEMARTKAQDQLARQVESDGRREEEWRNKWKELGGRVAQDRQWAEDQMRCWEESMEDHRRKMAAARDRGNLIGMLDLGGQEEEHGNGAAMGSDSNNLTETESRKDFHGDIPVPSS